MPSLPNLTTNVLLRSEETGGHVSVTEIVVPPHSAGPPLHTHDFDEAFYILEGELIFQVDDALVAKGAGELSFAARNVAHTLANHSDAPARYVLVCTPAGFERHWARIAADAAGVEPPQWALQPIPRSRSSARRSRGRREAAARGRSIVQAVEVASPDFYAAPLHDCESPSDRADHLRKGRNASTSDASSLTLARANVRSGRHAGRAFGPRALPQRRPREVGPAPVKPVPAPTPRRFRAARVRSHARERATARGLLR
jgi:quercetin dioxygenase-like cupin family protein